MQHRENRVCDHLSGNFPDPIEVLLVDECTLQSFQQNFGLIWSELSSFLSDSLAISLELKVDLFQDANFCYVFMV